MSQKEEKEVQLSIDELISRMLPSYGDKFDSIPVIPIEDITLFGDVVGVMVEKKVSRVLNSMGNNSEQMVMHLHSVLAKKGTDCNLDIEVGEIIQFESIVHEKNSQVNPTMLLPIKKTADVNYYLAVYPSVYVAAVIDNLKPSTLKKKSIVTVAQ